MFIFKKIIFLITLVLPLFFSTSVNAQSCTPTNGDANGDGQATPNDFSAWAFYFHPFNTISGGPSVGDFNCDGFTNATDFSIWSFYFDPFGGGGPTPTPPPYTPGTGIWISEEEIMRLPMSGNAWNNVLSAANSNWGSACLNDNNCTHDVNTLAGALVAVRTGDGPMRIKTINGIQSAMGSSLSRVLELSRGLQTYIIAADIIGYRTAEFENFVKDRLSRTTTLTGSSLSGHTGDGGLCNSQGSKASYCPNNNSVRCTGVGDATNWSNHARASLTAGALYLSQSSDPQMRSWGQEMLSEAVNAHKAFIGLLVPNHLTCNKNNTWHAESEKFGTNRRGTKIEGKFVSGVMPEDWRRGGGFSWLPTDSGYMWEGVQGHLVTAVMLHRANLVPFSSGDKAIVRTMDILHGTNESGFNEATANDPIYKNLPSSDDTWIPWVVNFYAGTNYPTPAASSGKNMGYTDWTHQ